VDARKLGQVKIGYRQNQSNKVVDIASCPILHPLLAKHVEFLLPRLRTLGCIQKIGHFECIQSKDGVVLVVNLSKPLSSADITIFEQLSESAKLRLICQYKEQTLLDRGQSFASLAIEDVPGIYLEIAEHHFIQVNASVNQQMIKQALEWLAPNEQSVVRDFFCGLGNFSLPLAKCSWKVIAYEVSDSMVAQATHNAKLNELNNAHFQTIDLSEPAQLKKLEIEQTDLVLLDPSREGAQALCELFIQKLPARIVYVSCNPNTLVRDLKILSTRYKVKALNVLDMFPFTQDLETMTLLELK
jgi:23S rRNA (uracil1939-C5)-methyltransferase